MKLIQSPTSNSQATRARPVLVEDRERKKIAIVDKSYRLGARGRFFGTFRRDQWVTLSGLRPGCPEELAFLGSVK
jgi:hypothetical protein